MQGVALPQQPGVETAPLVVRVSWYALVCVALALLLGLFAFQFTPRFQVAVAPYDRNFVSGMHAIEQIGSYTLRWTTGSAQLELPRPAANQPTLLRLQLLNARPPGAPDPYVTVIEQTQVRARFTVPPSLTGKSRHYMLLLPPANTASTRIGLDVTTIRPPADERDLGIAFIGATATALGGGLRLPAPQLLVQLALLALCGYGALRGAGVRQGVATVGVALGLLALTLALAMEPMAVLPFVPHLLALAALAAGGLALARWWAPPQVQGGRLVVSRHDLVIYMGLAWWLMPLFQHVLTWLGEPSVAPNPTTTLIGLGLAGALLLLSVARLAGLLAPERTRLALIVALVAASLAHTIFLVWFAFGRSGPDFWIHFRAVRAVARDGLPLYDLAGVAANHFGFSYKWPPFYVALLRPFVGFDGTLVLMGHRIVNMLLLALTAWLLLRQARHWTIGAALLLLFNFRPATDTMAFGQVDVLMLCGFTLVLLAAMRGRDDLAGAVVAILSLIKIYPVLLMAFFLVQGRWQAVRGAIVAGLACTAMSILAFGWQTHWFYLFNIVPIMGEGGGGTAWIENQTFNGWLSRMVAPQIVAEPFSVGWISLATYGFFGLMLGCAVLHRLRRPPPQPGATLDWNGATPLHFSLLAMILIIGVPAAWMHYHTVAILCFAALLLRPQPTVPLGQAALLALAYALVAYGNQWSFTNSAIAGGLGVLGYSYKFYGVLILWLVTLRVLGLPVALRALVQRHQGQAQRVAPLTVGGTAVSE
ncbi:MAG: DUF2029 domain-containing protein [Chloroflexaceae bacterium]|jgi:alpha-1,2-mannosyltransferase|nr:DUF2029 domain-containing protein [Chloroflexaceae bacterium]